MTTSRFVGPGVSSHAMGMWGENGGKKNKKTLEYGITKEETPNNERRPGRTRRETEKKERRKKNRIRDVCVWYHSGEGGQKQKETKKQRKEGKRRKRGAGGGGHSIPQASTRLDSNLFPSPLFSAPPRPSPGWLEPTAHGHRVPIPSIASSYHQLRTLFSCPRTLSSSTWLRELFPDDRAAAQLTPRLIAVPHLAST